jgi:hypothetical protein
MKTNPFALGLVLGVAALPAVAAPVAPEVRGVISRVDLDKMELQLEGRGLGVRGMPLTFTLDKDTQVLFGKDAGALSDLAVGRRARIAAEQQEGRSLAKVIHVVGARPAAPATRPDGNAVTGVLQRVAQTDREIVVIGPGARGPETETTISVPEAAKILNGDKAMPFEELKEGVKVTVQVEKRDGRLVAVTVQAGAGAAAPAGQSNVIPRLRMLLWLADQVLDRIEKERKEPER